MSLTSSSISSSAPSSLFERPRNPCRTTSSLVIQPGADPAEAYIDVIAPTLAKLEDTRPTVPSILQSGERPQLALDEAKRTLVPELDKWVEWSGRLEEFAWNYGEPIVGVESWMPTTDAVQDFKSSVRSLSDAIKYNNITFLRAYSFLYNPTTSDTPTLHTTLISDLLNSEVINTFMDWSRIRTNEAQDTCKIIPLAIPRCSSPEPMDTSLLPQMEYWKQPIS